MKKEWEKIVHEYSRVVKIIEKSFSPTNSNEKKVDHFMVKAPDYAATICRDNSGRVALIRNFRDNSEAYGLEIPSGYIEPGESPKETAIRETLEESGLIVDVVTELPFLYLETLVTSRAYTFLCNVKGETKQSLDDDENIEIVEWFSPKELEKLIFTGKIKDGHSYAAIATYLLMLNPGKV